MLNYKVFNRRLRHVALVFFRFTFAENNSVAKELQRRFNDNFMCMVMLKIFVHHHEKDICYTLDDEAE